MSKKSPIFLISLVVVVGVISIGPLLITPTSPFYNIDPETAFVANALQLIETGKVDYYGHPGTPVIVLLAHLFSPIKGFFILNGQNFVQWCLINYRLLFWISRGYFFLLFIIGYFIIHFVVYSQFRSYLANVFLLVIFFLDPSFQEISTKVATEPLAYIFFALWLFSFFIYQKTQKTKPLLSMAYISGVIVADKLIYLPIAIASLLIIILHKKHILAGLAIFLIGFFVSTLPIIYNYPKLAAWLFNISTKSGVYGTGGPGLINPKLFIDSASYWFNYRLGFLFLLLFVLLGIFRTRSHVNWKIITIVATLGFLYFMRYPVARYQQANILLLFTAAVFIYSKLSKLKQVVILILFFVPAAFYGRQDFTYKRTLVAKSANLQMFIDNLPPDEEIVWEYAEAEDFALIRARNDSGYFISPQLSTIKPHMWELVSQTFTDIRNNSDKTFDISCLCWDGIVMQEKSFSYFVSKQKTKIDFSIEKIPETDMLYIRNDI